MPCTSSLTTLRFSSSHQSDAPCPIVFLAIFASLTPTSLTASTGWRLNRGRLPPSPYIIIIILPLSLHLHLLCYSHLFIFLWLILLPTPIRDSLPHKPRSCDILELLNTLFSFPSLKCSLNSGFFLSSLLKYGSNYSYYVLKPLRRPFFPPQS